MNSYIFGVCEIPGYLLTPPGAPDHANVVCFMHFFGEDNRVIFLNNKLLVLLFSFNCFLILGSNNVLGEGKCLRGRGLPPSESQSSAVEDIMVSPFSISLGDSSLCFLCSSSGRKRDKLLIYFDEHTFVSSRLPESNRSLKSFLGAGAVIKDSVGILRRAPAKKT